MLLLRVTAALGRARVSYALVGGYAVALHGAIRGTVDIDLVLRLKEPQFVAAEKALRGIGLEPRLPVDAAEVFRFREEYIKNRNLTAWTFVNPGVPSEIVDIVLTHDLSDMKTSTVRVQGGQVRLVALPDLIAMKKESGRPQDREDVRALEALRGFA
jgi:hypothetical protein